MSAALHQFIARGVGEVFCWGRWDCVMAAADAVLAQTGHDLAAGHRGTYSTAGAAAVLLQRLGGVRALGAQAGPAIPPMQARAGDVGVIEHQGRESLAVCAGELWLCPAVDRGWSVHPMTAAVAAWRVTHA